MGPTRFSGIIGEAPGFTRLPDLGCILFVQGELRGHDRCHLFFIESGRDVVLDQDTEHWIIEMIANRDAVLATKALGPDEFVLTCRLPYRSRQFKFDLAKKVIEAMD